MRPHKMPLAEIRFAARAGFLSRPIWEEFFATGSTRWRRKRWGFLKEQGLFVPYPSRFTNDVLVLNRRSPEVKAVVGEAISTHPFFPQIEHDEAVSRILLTLAKHPKVLGYRIEAELKRELLVEKGLPRGRVKAKFPDGVIEVAGPKGPMRIALEVETSHKDQKRYREIVASYAARKDLSRVLFLARAKPIFDNLKAAMQAEFYPNWERPVGFGDLDGWLKNPASASIYFSDGVTTLEKIMSSPSPQTATASAI